MKIERNPAALVVPKNGAIDVVCPSCGIRTINEYGRNGYNMTCSYCNYTWRVNSAGCPPVVAQKNKEA